MAAKPPQVSVSPLTRRGGGFPIAPATPSARLLCNLVVIQRWQVAAALSAAVTTTKPIGDRAHLSGGTKSEEPYTPNASYSSGEGVWGRGASLREAASPPESPSLPFVLALHFA